MTKPPKISFPENLSRKLLIIFHFCLFLADLGSHYHQFDQIPSQEAFNCSLCVCSWLLWKPLYQVCMSWAWGTHSDLLGSSVSYQPEQGWLSPLVSYWLTGFFPSCGVELNNQLQMRLAQGSGILYLVGGSLFSLCLLEISPKNPTLVFFFKRVNFI